MNRNSTRDSLVAARNFPVSHNHRRGHSLNGFSKDTDENLDLFSKNRRSLSVASSDDSSDGIILHLLRLSCPFSFRFLVEGDEDIAVLLFYDICWISVIGLLFSASFMVDLSVSSGLFSLL